MTLLSYPTADELREINARLTDTEAKRRFPIPSPEEMSNLEWVMYPGGTGNSAYELFVQNPFFLMCQGSFDTIEDAQWAAGEIGRMKYPAAAYIIEHRSQEKPRRGTRIMYRLPRGKWKAWDDAWWQAFSEPWRGQAHIVVMDR